MAATQVAQFRFSLEDELTTRATMVCYALIDPDVALSTHLGNLHGVGSAIEACTGLVVVRAELVLPDQVAYAHATPTAGVRVEDGALFNFHNTATPKSWSIFLPGISGILAGNRVDLTNPDVMAFVAVFLPGGIASGGMTTSHQEPIDALNDVELVARRFRRQLQRTTFERG